MKKIKEEKTLDKIDSKFNIESKICKYLKETLHLMMGKIIIEFLTINLFAFVKNEIQNERTRLKKETQQINDVELDEQLKEKISRDSVMDRLIFKAAEKLEPQVDRLQSQILSRFKKRLIRTFSNPEKARKNFYDSKTRFDAYFESRYFKMRLLKNLPQTPKKKIDRLIKINQSGRFRLILFFISINRIFKVLLIQNLDKMNFFSYLNNFRFFVLK